MQDDAFTHIAVVAEAERRRIFRVRTDIAVEGAAISPASFDYAGLSVGVLAGGEHCRLVAVRSAIREAVQRGVIVVESADVVVADRLAPPDLLAELPPHVEVIDAAKIPRAGAWPRTPSTPS